MNVAAAAHGYLRRGFMPVPIPLGQKAPRLKGWQHFAINDDEINGLFEGNVGLLLGAASNGLIDVDLDSPEAIALAPYFLPQTAMIHGRAGKRRSHYWYRVEMAASTKQFKDPSGACLLELRGTGGQTVVPPSLHPSGETIEWDEHGEPTSITYDEIRAAASKLAAAALLLRRYPHQGSRQDFALAVSGTLCKGGMPADEVIAIVTILASVAGDDELEKRKEAARQTTERLKSSQPVTGLHALVEIIGDAETKRICEWLHLSSAQPPLAATSSANTSERVQGLFTQLLELAGDAELFHTPEDEAYVTITGPLGAETFPIESQRFDQWISSGAKSRFNFLPREQLLKETRYHLAAVAKYVGPCHPVFLRISGNSSKILLDLSDTERHVVDITAEGWTVTTNCSARFIRPGGMHPLPCPKSLHDLSYFSEFFNVSSPDDLRLILAWLLFALNPVGPYPVLILQGEAGSAKSSMARMLKALTDPAELRSFPRSEQDFAIAARTSHVLAFDNLSGLSERDSDVLCRVATGAGFATRQLYSNFDEVRFIFRRPVILTGIVDIATRQDLIDRALVIHLPSIPADQRRDETTLNGNFKSALPFLLGALLSCLAAGLQRISSTVLTKAPRMADFARWSTAAECSLGWEPGGFLRAFAANQGDAFEIGIESSPVAESIMKMLTINAQWSGTATELLDNLFKYADDHVRRSRAWPANSSKLGNEVRRLAPALRAMLVEVTFGKDGSHRRTRIISLRKTASGSVDKPDVRAVRPVHPAYPAPGSPPLAQPNTCPAMAMDSADVADGQSDNPAPVASPSQVPWWRRLVDGN